MRKGELVRAVLVVLAVALAVTGSWGLLVFGAAAYRLIGVVVEALMRRGQRRSQGIEEQFVR